MVWDLYNEELTCPKRSLVFILSPWEVISRSWNVLPHREYPCLPEGFGHHLSNKVIYDEGFGTTSFEFLRLHRNQRLKVLPRTSRKCVLRLKVSHSSNMHDQVLIKTLNLWILTAHGSFPVCVTYRGQEEITQSRSAQGEDDQKFHVQSPPRCHPMHLFHWLILILILLP